MKSDDLLKQFDEGQLKKFEEDVVWKAFCGVIEDRLELVRNEIEAGVASVGSGKEAQLIVIDSEGIKRRQGECSSLRFLLALPETVKQQWEQEELKKKKEE